MQTSLEEKLFAAGWKHAPDLLRLFQNVSLTFVIHVPCCSFPADISLAFIDIYCMMLSCWEDGDSSLFKAALGLFAAAPKAIMYLSPTAKCHTPHRSSFCVLFSVRQRENMSYFPMAVKGKYGDQKYLGKA